MENKEMYRVENRITFEVIETPRRAQALEEARFWAEAYNGKICYKGDNLYTVERK